MIENETKTKTNSWFNPKSKIIVFAVPFANQNTQPKHDHDRILYQKTTTTTATLTQKATKTPDDESISRSINHNNPYRDSSFIHADVADAGGVGGGDGGDDSDTAITTPLLSYSNNNTQSNSNSIFMPASTSKYPIKQNTIIEDLRERYVNFRIQWTRTIVYLERKWLTNSFTFQACNDFDKKRAQPCNNWWSK